MTKPSISALKPLFACMLVGSLAFSPLALAQGTVPNPLRPQPSAPAQTAPAQTDVKTKQEAAKPKRERSAKQKQSDEDMRTCGASWRADKPALTAKGETWRNYLKDCRGKLKAGRG
ncbi:MAG: hypothetical protein ACRCWF_17175 [Beijerinckiaceae bacterium]